VEEILHHLGWLKMFFTPTKNRAKQGKTTYHEISQFPYSSSEVKITARKGVLARPTLRHGTGADCWRK